MNGQTGSGAICSGAKFEMSGRWYQKYSHTKDKQFTQDEICVISQKISVKSLTPDDYIKMGGYKHMKEIKIFENKEFGKIRMIIIDGEPWFVGRDVAEALGYSNASKAVSVHVSEDDRVLKVLETGSQNGNVVKTQTALINESGMYTLILGSKLESAKRFKHWVTSEVLPSIRKNGTYNALPKGKELLALAVLEAQKVIEQQNADIERMRPKEEFFDAVVGSKDAIEIGKVAKILNFPGIGRNKLFSILRKKKILMENNIPYQKYIDSGWFRTIEQKYSTPDGEVKISIKTLVYQKGVNHIRNMLCSV